MLTNRSCLIKPARTLSIASAFFLPYTYSIPFISTSMSIYSTSSLSSVPGLSALE